MTTQEGSTRLRRVALLSNPTAGKGRGAAARETALQVLGSAGVEVVDLVGTDAADAQRLAAQAVAEGVDALLAAGGDGMVHLATQVLAGTGTPLGVVPAGTGNDVARHLGLPRDDVAAAVRHLLTAQVTPVDVADAGGTAFVTVLCAGFDAIVNERANQMRWPRGQMRYNLATLAELRTFRPLGYRLELDGKHVELEAMMVSVGNLPSFGGGLRIAEGARVDDGFLDVVVIKPVSKLELVKTYPKLFKGTHLSHPAFERYRVRSVDVVADGIVAYADGERLGPLPMTVTARPGALHVLS
ncbi:diacylglycerol/lipid kinase family protein [Nocardioides bruguierae]|uniref:diacylglycerol/lipid kinase family protein n=1 Tax=Nocardioides bruguierae TaxID=2945102 RepID=UPI002020AE30|nr:YegS/Rv2252/BmrU family lipid kinase [Nocardioides bruguierae]MCL8025874.1 YegS/Rv2252/BmrU family lipid kinase [Nocardioides bruguierae]